MCMCKNLAEITILDLNNLQFCIKLEFVDYLKSTIAR